MSRKLRIEYPGAMYHVMNRGDQREDIFRDDHDRQKFLAALREACVKTEWQMGRELERLGWDEYQLRARRKGHRSKVMLARLSLAKMLSDVAGQERWVFCAGVVQSSNGGLSGITAIEVG